MRSLHILLLGAVVALVLPLASAAAAPAVLPAVTRALHAGVTIAPAACSATPAGAPGVAAATYTAPMSGYLTTRLTGAGGDWDLLLRDASSGERIGGSQGFGGRELVQTWIGAGQRVVAQGCRRPGAAPDASVAFSLVDVAPPAGLGGHPSLVRVRGTATQLAGVDRLKGVDVTESRGRDWADVVVDGGAASALLARTGLPLTTRIADLQASYDRSRAADRAYAAAVGADGSPLPSGRTTYRTPEDIQAELKALVDEHPDLARPVVLGQTFQGRDISGVEIAHDVGADDGRPTYFLMGAHHAREWPSAEAAMEFATMMVKDAGQARISSLLDRERVVVVPVVNVDGYVETRGALDLADTSGDPGDVLSLVESVAPPGGSFAYRRKNCDGELSGPTTPCELTWGVDNNRNYGNLWGGPGSSSDVTSQSYHGPAPRSEPETQAVWNFARTHNVTFLMTLHTVAALVLRPPGLHDAGLAPDEARMKQLGDAMGAAAGYTSQYSWQLYDTAGTTEDDTYAATGAYGYTIEMGPPGGNFHEAYETGVVDEWTGDNDHAQGHGGLREALLIAAESAADPADHAVIRGHAPAGRVLRLKRAFDTVTSPFCAKGIEPVVDIGIGATCLTGAQDPLTLHDAVDATTVVPEGGSYAWHVNQSTRPFVGGGAVKETLQDVDPPVATFTGTPAAPTGTADHAFTLSQSADKVKVSLDATLPEDYDLEVLRKAADGSLTSVGTSANAPGTPESVVLDAPPAGDYVARVTYYAAVTGSYTVKVVRAVATRETTSGHREAYTMTCEDGSGNVLETRDVTVDRGQTLDVDLACGEAGTAAVAPRGAAAAGDSTPVTAAAQPVAAAPAPAVKVTRTTATKAAAKTSAQQRAAARRRAARLASCRRSAKRLRSAKRRTVALRSCKKRFG